VFIVDF